MFSFEKQKFLSPQEIPKENRVLKIFEITALLKKKKG